MRTQFSADYIMHRFLRVLPLSSSYSHRGMTVIGLAVFAVGCSLGLTLIYLVVKSGKYKGGNSPHNARTRATGNRNISLSIGMRRWENAAGNFNRQLEKYPGRPNRQFLELWKMPGG
jgi:hypothetical protein